MSSSSYKPLPIDVAGIQLPDEMAGLVEQLALNTHEVWAQERIRQGWRYGPVRNDERKEHPCLVPYNELPESEKDIDRQTVKAMLKAILGLGFQIKTAGE